MTENPYSSSYDGLPLTALFKAAPLAVIVVDLEGKVLMWNPSAELIFGWSQEEVIGKPNPIIPAKRYEEFRLILNRIFSGESFSGLEVKRQRKDGSLVDMRLSTSGIRNINGEVTAIIGMLEDITEKKDMENALIDSEKTYRLLFESNPHPMWVYDLETLSFLAVNGAAIIHYGYTKEEFLSMTIKDIRPPEDIPHLLENIASVTEGIDRAGIWRHRKKDGSIINVEIISHIMTFNGRPAELVLANDVTESINAEKALKETEERFRTFFESASDSIFIVDQNGQLLDCNKTAYERLGYTKGEMLSKNVSELDPPEFATKVPERIGQIRKYGKAVFESAHIRKDGTIMPVEINAILINFKGKTVLLSIIRDITERKKAEEAINRRLQFEKTVSSISSRFLTYSDIDDSINVSLAEIGFLTGASRSYIYLFDDENMMMDNTHEWCAEGVSHRIDSLKNIPLTAFPWLMENILQNEVVNIDDISRLPDEARAEKEAFERVNIKSLLILPLFLGNKISGFIGLDNTKGRWKLRDEDIDILKVTSEIFGNALKRKKMEDMLERSKLDWEDTFNTLTDMVTVHDKNYDIIRANKSAEKILGLSFLNGKSCDKCFAYYHGTEAPPAGCPSCKSLITGKPSAFELFEPHLNMFIEIRAIPRFDSEGKIAGLIHVVRDITERHQATEKILHLNRIYSMLSGINETIVHATNKEQLFSDVCRIAVENGKFIMAWIGISDESTLLVSPVASYGVVEGYLDKITISLDEDTPEGKGPTGTALREEKYFVCNDIEEAEFMGPWRDEALKRGYRSSAAFPVKFSGDTLGVINLYSDKKGIFDEEEIRLLTEVANDVSFAVDTLENEEMRRKAEEELKNKIEELERFYSMAVGRELKMKELKKEIERLTDLLSKQSNR